VLLRLDRRRRQSALCAMVDDRGDDNHFAAWQEPALFTDELRAGFRALR
jgi:hypothetical protein